MEQVRKDNKPPSSSSSSSYSFTLGVLMESYAAGEQMQKR